jgi:putative oxidoreductase
VSPTRSLARPLLASMFVAGGVDALRNPGPRVEQVRDAGLAEPERLVQVNGATQLFGGVALATGRLPRLASLALAGTLVPTTYVGHAFWKETDPDAKKLQQISFLKNVSMLGGLLLAAADTGGRESVPHAVGRVSRRTKRKAEKAAKKAGKATKAQKKKLHA